MSHSDAGQPPNAGPGSDRDAPAPRAPRPQTADPSTPLRVPSSEHADTTPEQQLWAGRGDWKYQFNAVAVWAVTAVAALIMAYFVASADHGWIRWLAWIVILLVGLRAVWIVVSHVYGTRYRLTTERLFVDRGLLSRTTDQVELIRVDDVRVHQRMLDRLFKIGSVEVLSTDVSDAKVRIAGIREPDRVAEHIRDHMRALRKKSLFIENL
jgi:membrane protein YdbS with pleckstrin-like domain